MVVIFPHLNLVLKINKHFNETLAGVSRTGSITRTALTLAFLTATLFIYIILEILGKYGDLGNQLVFYLNWLLDAGVA